MWFWIGFALVGILFVCIFYFSEREKPANNEDRKPQEKKKDGDKKDGKTDKDKKDKPWWQGPAKLFLFFCVLAFVCFSLSSMFAVACMQGIFPIGAKNKASTECKEIVSTITFVPNFEKESDICWSTMPWSTISDTKAYLRIENIDTADTYKGYLLMRIANGRIVKIDKSTRELPEIGAQYQLATVGKGRPAKYRITVHPEGCNCDYCSTRARR